MSIEQHARSLVEAAVAQLAAEGSLAPASTSASFTVEKPKRPGLGDVATNAALALQKAAGRPPRAIAELLASRLVNAPGVASVELAGPGFLNLRLAPAVFHAVLDEVQKAGAGYGRAPAATGERILVEFVSANPTGPLLLSHARGAIVGDAVASVLEAAGHRVVREYYVNDFGNQVRLFGESVRAKAEGRPAPEGGYDGDYVAEVAAWVKAHEPQALASADPSVLARLSVTRMLDGVPGSKLLPGIQKTLADLGVHHDVWTSEESLHRWGRVSASLADLRARGALEERDGALFFKSEGDDKDRVVQKSDGSFTYFASDIAYHAQKLARGFDRLIDVWGADHHGYVARIQGALAALDLPAARFEVLLTQLVYLTRNGERVKMGKRLGNIVTIEEVVDEIDEAAQRKGAGADALRFFYLARHSDKPVEVDIEVAKKASLDNPVFYLQMGHARASSILSRAREVFGLEPSAAGERGAFDKLVHPDELAIAGHLGRYPGVLAEAAELREPHRVLFYLQELSQLFQSYFTRLKDDPVLPQTRHTQVPGWESSWDFERSRQRLAWVSAIRTVYGAGLRVLGITAPDRMPKLPSPSAAEEEISA